MAYVLARDGQPPFVLSPENAAPYVAISASIRGHPQGQPGDALPALRDDERGRLAPRRARRLALPRRVNPSARRRPDHDT